MPAVISIDDKSEDRNTLDKTRDGAEDTSSKKYSNSEDLNESAAHQQTKILHSAFLTEVDDEEYEEEEEEEEEEYPKDSNSGGNQTSTIFISLNPDQSKENNPIDEIESSKIEESQVQPVALESSENNKVSEVSFEINSDKQQPSEEEVNERSEMSIQIGSAESQDSSETLSFISHRLLEPNEILDVKYEENGDGVHGQVSETQGKESFAHLGNSFVAHQVALFSADFHGEPKEVVESLNSRLEFSEPSTVDGELLKTQFSIEQEEDASISPEAQGVAHFGVDLEEKTKGVVESLDSHVKSSEPPVLSEESVKTEIDLDKEKDTSISFVAHQVESFRSDDVNVAESINNDDVVCLTDLVDDDDDVKCEERVTKDFIEESVDFGVVSKEEADNSNNNSKDETDMSVNASIIDSSPIESHEESETMPKFPLDNEAVETDSFVDEAREYSEDEESVIEEIIQEVIIQPLGTKCETELQDGNLVHKADAINNNLIHTSTQEYHVLKDEEVDLVKKNKDTYKSEITIELDSAEEDHKSSKPEEETYEEVNQKSFVFESETESFQNKESSKLIHSQEGDDELEIDNKILEQNINSELNANEIQDGLEQSNDSTDHIVMEPVSMDISYTESHAPDDDALEETDISSEFQIPNNEEIGPSDAIDVTKIPNLQKSAIKDSLEELTHRQDSRSANDISKASVLKTDFVQESSHPLRGLEELPMGNVLSITPESIELIESSVTEPNDSSHIISNDFPYSREELTCMGIAFLALLIGFLIQFF